MTWPRSSDSPPPLLIVVLFLAFSDPFAISPVFGTFSLFAILSLFASLVSTVTLGFAVTSRLEYVVGFLLELCSTVIVLFVSCMIFPRTFLNAPFSVDPRTFSQISIMESASSLKSSRSISIAGSFSKIKFSIRYDFGVFGSLPVCFSIAEFPSEPFSERIANSILDNPFFFFEIITSLFVFNLSLMVRIISTLPFPL